MLVVDAAGVELVAPNGEVTVEDPPNTELVLPAVANEPAPKTGAAPNPEAAGVPALAVAPPNAGGLVALAPNAGAGLVPNEGTAPKLGAAPVLLLVVALPKMLLLVAATGAAVAALVVTVGAAPPNENAPLALFAAVVPDGCAVAPNEKLELADGTAPNVLVDLAADAAAPNMPAEGEVTVEMLELTTLPNAGGAVVGGAAVVAAPNPPNVGVAAAVVVVVVAPNEGMADVVLDPNANLGAAVLVAPKAGGAAELADVAPPNENALVVVAVVVDDATVGFGILLFPNEKPPADVKVVAGAVIPEVDAVMFPKEGTAADAMFVVTVEEAVGDRGLKALNPEPLPKAAMGDFVVVKVF